jgi:hypothetical protein
MNVLPRRVPGKQAPQGQEDDQQSRPPEAGHALVGLMTGRKVVEAWVRGKEGCVEFEPLRWFPGGVARIRRGLAVDAAGYLAEDLAAGVDRERLSRRLAGGYSGPVHLDDRSAVRKAWAIRTGELLDDYHAEQVFWQQAGHSRHEEILAEVVRAERRAERILNPDFSDGSIVSAWRLRLYLGKTQRFRGVQRGVISRSRWRRRAGCGDSGAWSNPVRSSSGWEIRCSGPFAGVRWA